MKKILTASAVCLTLAGCATGNYQPPSSTATIPSKEVTVNAPFNVVWQDLIDYASTNFFGIDQFEKDSGLMTLSFGSKNPSKYIDCGTMSATAGSKTFNGSYVNYLVEKKEATLSGKMNITVRAISKNQARVRVNARYVFSAPERRVSTFAGIVTDPSITFTFDSDTPDSVRVANPMPGSPPNRVCRATGAAEKAILDEVSRIGK